MKFLANHIPARVHNLTHVGPVDSTQPMSLSVHLSHRARKLDKYLSTMDKRKALTPAEFGRKFGAKEHHIKDVIDYFQSHGFDVSQPDVTNLVLNISGTVAAVNKAFSTELHHYNDPNQGHLVHAPKHELQVPDKLKIASVLGIETTSKKRAHFRAKQVEATRAPSVPTGLSPSQIKTAYQIPSTYNGTDQAVALFELDGFTVTDIEAYIAEYNLGTSISQIKTVTVDNVTGYPTHGPNSGAPEVTLDIQLVLSVAPKATIYVYEGPNSSQGVIDTYKRIANDNLASVISTSWGEAEIDVSSAFLNAEKVIFQQMATQFQTIYAAAGDSGSYDNGRSLSVDDPASQPYVTGVGGTSLILNANNTRHTEVVWNDGLSGGGSGGGISAIWPISSYQVGVAGTASTTHRNVPDVALNADEKHGYSVYYGGAWTQYGGTSCAAPLWAALTALLNQTGPTGSRIGFINPLLYTLAKTTPTAFYDVISGTNALSANEKGYAAHPGYDNCSGLGCYEATILINALKSQVTVHH